MTSGVSAGRSRYSRLAGPVKGAAAGRVPAHDAFFAQAETAAVVRPEKRTTPENVPWVPVDRSSMVRSTVQAPGR